MKKIKVFFVKIWLFVKPLLPDILFCGSAVVLGVVLALGVVLQRRSNSRSASAAVTDPPVLYLHSNTFLTFSASNVNYQQGFTCIPLNLMIKSNSIAKVDVYMGYWESSLNDEYYTYKYANNLRLPSVFIDTSYLTKSTTVRPSNRGNISATYDTVNSTLMSTDYYNAVSYSIDYTTHATDENSYTIDIYFNSDTESLGFIRLLFSGFSFPPSCYPLSLSSPILTTDENVEYNLGYENGYNVGIKSTVDDILPWDAITSGVDSFFDIKLFGTVSIGTVFKIVCSTLLIGFIIKIFLGG